MQPVIAVGGSSLDDLIQGNTSFISIPLGSPFSIISSVIISLSLPEKYSSKLQPDPFIVTDVWDPF